MTDRLEELCRQLISRGIYGRYEGRGESPSPFLDCDYATTSILSDIEDELEERGIVVRERGHKQSSERKDEVRFTLNGGIPLEGTTYVPRPGDVILAGDLPVDADESAKVEIVDIEVEDRVADVYRYRARIVDDS